MAKTAQSKKTETTKTPETTAKVVKLKRCKALETLQKLEAEMTSAFVGREELTRATILALIAREHVVMLGPPGTAKSLFATAFSRAIGQDKPFQRLLTRYSIPEEIFGPTDIQALKMGEFKTVTKGYMPEAKVAFLDEIFKANSSILNALLTILNERTFAKDRSVGEEKVPLELCLAASNEYPEPDTSALWDRFLIRFWIDYLPTTQLAELIDGVENGDPLDKITTNVSAKALEKARTSASKIPLSDSLKTVIVKLVHELDKKGFRPSDRKVLKVLKLAKASAYYAGRKEATPQDMEVAKHCLWDNHKDRDEINTVLFDVCFPAKGALTKIQDEATDEYQTLLANVTKAEAPQAIALIAGFNAKLETFHDLVDKVERDFPEAEASADIVRDRLEYFEDSVKKTAASVISPRRRVRKKR